MSDTALHIDTSFEELIKVGFLSKRVTIYLARVGIKCVKDLMGYDIHGLKMLRIPRLGTKGKQEVFDLMKALKKTHTIAVRESLPYGFEKASELMNRAYQSIIHSHTQEAWEFQTIYPNVYMLHVALMDEQQPWLVPEEGMTLDSHMWTRRLIKSYLSMAINLMEGGGCSDIPCLAAYQQVLQVADKHLQWTHLDKFRYFLSEPKQRQVRLAYAKLLNGWPKKVRALVDKQGLSLERWIALHESGLDGYNRLSPSLPSKAMVNRFFQLGESLHKEIDYWLSVDTSS